MEQNDMQRLPAEQLFQKEIDALIAAEKDPVPTGWRMSPRSVRTYICGGKAGGVEITPKYIGQERLVEIAIATLVTDRALLLIGEPGTAKSWLSEHLTAAINGDSTKVIQGTAGTTEEQIRYSWNYAMLIAQGPSLEAMLKSPVMTAMETGTIARVEEISRCASEVQDALISILSEKRISVPELGLEVPAKKGFSVIATANTRDKGVNEMSAALKRRFNIVVLPAPAALPAVHCVGGDGDRKNQSGAAGQRAGSERIPAGLRRGGKGLHHLPGAQKRGDSGPEPEGKGFFGSIVYGGGDFSAVQQHGSGGKLRKRHHHRPGSGGRTSGGRGKGRRKGYPGLEGISGKRHEEKGVSLVGALPGLQGSERIRSGIDEQ